MSDLATILPPNSGPVEYDLEQFSGRVADLAKPVSELWDVENCPVSLLPWLAWALSVDNWDSGWSETTKRATLREAVRLHRSKGTVGAVKRALAAAGYGLAEVVENFGWEKYDGAHLYDGSFQYSQPDHWAEYRVNLARPITVEQAAQVRDILSSVAPARCHLKSLDFTEALNIHAGRIRYDGQYTYGVA